MLMDVMCHGVSPYVAESMGESCCVVHKATGLCK